MGIGQDYWASPYPNEYPYGNYVAGLAESPRAQDVDALRRRLGLPTGLGRIEFACEMNRLRGLSGLPTDPRLDGLGKSFFKKVGKKLEKTTKKVLPKAVHKGLKKVLAFTPLALVSKDLKKEFKKTLLGGPCVKPVNATPEQEAAYQKCRATRKKRTKQTVAAAAAIAATVATVATGGLASPVLQGPLSVLKAGGSAVGKVLGKAGNLVKDVLPDNASDALKEKLTNELMAKALMNAANETAQEEGVEPPQDLGGSSDMTKYIPYAVAGLAGLGILAVVLMRRK